MFFNLARKFMKIFINLKLFFKIVHIFISGNFPFNTSDELKSVYDGFSVCFRLTVDALTFVTCLYYQNIYMSLLDFIEVYHSMFPFENIERSIYSYFIEIFKRIHTLR